MSARTENKRGPYAKTQERRQAISEAVFELVQLHGHRGLTTADVARRAGVTEATVLYHFPSKEHLFVAAMEYPWTRGPGPRDELGSLADVERHLFVVTRHTTARPFVAQLYGSLMAEASHPDHPGHEPLRVRTDRMIGLFQDVFARLAAGGEVELAHDPQRCARLFIAAWDGLQAQWLVTQDFNLGAEVVAVFRALARAPR